MLVLQMVEPLPNIVQFFAALSPVPEQVIEVPKILPHDVPMRRLCREPQLAEQVVEVPTILYFLLTLQFRMVVVELPEVFKAFSLDTVRRSGLRTRSLTLQLRAVVYGVFKVVSQNRVQQRLVKQIIVFQQRLSTRSLTILLPVEAFKIYAQDRVLRHPLALHLILRMTHFKGFFLQRYCCGPAVPMTAEVPQIQFLCRRVPVLCHGGWGPAVH